MGVLHSLARLAPITAARIDWLDRRKQWPWGGPMNGQPLRQLLARQIVDATHPPAIVETGTFRAATTVFFANISGAPVYSCELSPRYHAFAQRRTSGLESVNLHLGDSRSFLSGLVAQEVVRSSHVLFYLDAHWYDDMPLWDELRIVFANWDDPVVIVDDFEVPGDNYYGFDDYGRGRRLAEADMPADVRACCELLYPTEAGRLEGGARRGCVVITTAAVVPRLVKHCSLFVRAS